MKTRIMVVFVFLLLIAFPPAVKTLDYYTVSCPNYVVLSSPINVTVQKTVDGVPTCDNSLQVQVVPPSATPTVYAASACSGSGPNIFLVDSSQNGRYRLIVLSAGVQRASCEFSAVYKPGSQVPEFNFLLLFLSVLLAVLVLGRLHGRRRKSQLTIEFFFALTLFALLLPWLSYYAGSTKSSAVAANALLQQELLARDLVKGINQACVTNTSITLQLPCVRVGETNLNYSVFSAGSLVFVRGESPFQQTASKNASCEPQYFLFTPECNSASGNAGSVCINVSGGKPFVALNACQT